MFVGVETQTVCDEKTLVGVYSAVYSSAACVPT
jgi:hypothetical protein